MKEDVIREIKENVAQFRTPAYFTLMPSNLYGPKALVFKAAQDINLVDLGDPATFTSILRMIKKAARFDVAKALMIKADAKPDGYGRYLPTHWSTASNADTPLANWFQRVGFEGWRIPFLNDELMLTSVTKLVYQRKHKW